jgi:hypothetical protein
MVRMEEMNKPVMGMDKQKVNVDVLALDDRSGWLHSRLLLVLVYLFRLAPD